MTSWTAYRSFWADVKTSFSFERLGWRGRSRRRFQWCYPQAVRKVNLYWIKQAGVFPSALLSVLRPVWSYEACSNKQLDQGGVGHHCFHNNSISSLVSISGWACSLCLCLARWRVCSCAPTCSSVSPDPFSLCSPAIYEFLLSNGADFVLLWAISIKTLAASSTGQVGAAGHWLQKVSELLLRACRGAAVLFQCLKPDWFKSI